ncbi:M15 family metallopeptidase [Candidatus Nomurabacteria bacterium]|nr:M15 family metallopeptidase [Candidatus Nomurabacteria bacterium]
MSLEEALSLKEIPSEIKNTLQLVDVEYFSFGGVIEKGQIVVRKDLANEVKFIFSKLLEWKFPIEKIIPVNKYDWSDDKSMEDNNSSAFNYRVIYGTDRLSKHSYGTAIDINPVQNPYFPADGTVHPKNGKYEPAAPGTITVNSDVVNLFESLGWQWGGRWENKDWQHFEKKL